MLYKEAEKPLTKFEVSFTITVTFRITHKKQKVNHECDPVICTNK